LHNTQVTIGAALLPTLTHLLNAATAWLNKANESGQIQRGVNQVMRVATQVMHGVADGLRVIRAVITPVNHLLGGTKNSMKLLTLAFVAFKLRGVVSLVAGVGTAIKALARLTIAEDLANAGAPTLPGQPKLPGFPKNASKGSGAIKAVKNIIKYGGPAAVGGAALGPLIIGVTQPKSATYGAPQQYSTDGKGHFFRLIPTRAGSARKVPVSQSEYDAVMHIHIHGDVTLPHVTNHRQFVTELQRMAKRQAHQTRGRHGGTKLGIH
jgi:hypothetical protein